LNNLSPTVRPIKLPRRTLVQRAFTHTADNLSRRVVHGVTFTFLGIALRTSITVGSMSILARLLTPADFGHLAMATVVTELAALFANFGFGSILIQRPRVSRIQLDTVFWASLALGIIFSGAVFALSFFTESLFADPVAGQLLRLLCLTFVLSELTVVPSSLMSRLFMFRQMLSVQVTLLVFRAGTAVLMAWAGWGVWSLVGGALAGNFAQWAALTHVVRYRPRLRFHRGFLRSTWRTNGSYFGGGLLFYVNSNVDLFIIARAMGATSLGVYQNARSVTDEIRARIAMPLQRVLFPAFSAMQNDLPRFQDGVRRSGRLLALVVVPIGFGVASVAQELVPILYGSQWLDMIPILQIVSAGAGIRAATTVGSPIYNATNRVGLSLRLNTLFTILMVSSIAVGSRWGTIGVAYALLFGAGLSLVMFRIALGLIDLRTSDLLSILGAPLAAAAIMAAAVTLLRPIIEDILPGLALRFAFLVIAGVAIYAGVMLAIGRDYVAAVLEAIKLFRRH